MPSAPPPSPTASDATQPSVKKQRTAYQAFVTDERAKLLSEGAPRGAATMAEIRRRWAARKSIARDDKGDPLLMLTFQEDDDAALEKLVAAIAKLDAATIKAELSLHSLPVSGSKTDLVERLALAMVGA